MAFIPAWVLAGLIWAHGVNTPVWDDWERGPLLEKYYAGELTWNDLYAPHIDHRIMFPRLVILALNELTGGNLKYEMGWSWLMAFLAGLGVWRLAARTIFKGHKLWAVVFAANLIIFSPITWDNWVWGVQIAFLMPMTCTVWALVVAQKTEWRWWARLLCCGVLAIIGTHSFGHGFAVWPAVLGYSLLSYRFTQVPRQRFFFAGIWLVLATVVIGCYALLKFENSSDSTHSYGQAVGEPPPSVINKHKVLEMPLEAAHFLATLAGSGFARFHLVDVIDVARVMGWLLLSLFVVLGAHRVFTARRDSEGWNAALPWLALAGAALMGMAAVTIGRFHFAGPTRAASIRYVSISLYLALAVLMLVVLWWRSARFSKLPAMSTWGTLAVGIFCGFMIPAWVYGSQMMRLCEQARLQGHAALTFINFWEPEVYWRIDAGPAMPRKYANFLDQRGLLNPPMVKSLDLAQFKPLHRDRPISQAGIRTFEVLKGSGNFLVKGHASVDGRPADLVLFTWETSDLAPTIFAGAEPTVTMVQQQYPNDLELVGRRKPGRTDYCLWEDELRHKDMGFMAHPEVNKVTVRAWVFDVVRQRAYRIKGAWEVNRDGTMRVLDKPGATMVAKTEDP